LPKVAKKNCQNVGKKMAKFKKSNTNKILNLVGGGGGGGEGDL
jgi:hypothetical protein